MVLELKWAGVGSDLGGGSDSLGRDAGNSNKRIGATLGSLSIFILALRFLSDLEEFE